jgi:hypothetical protein
VSSDFVVLTNKSIEHSLLLSEVCGWRARSLGFQCKEECVTHVYRQICYPCPRPFNRISYSFLSVIPKLILKYVFG